MSDTGNKQETETQAPESKSIDTATGQAASADISSARVKKIFTDIAWKYERFNLCSSFGQYRSWLNKLIDLAPITPESLMLDVAGGTGDVTFTACERKAPGAVILSDYTPAMLEVAKARLDAGENHGVPVELCVVDGQDIHCDDNEFDVITMSYGIRNMPKREQALSEMYRVLKPGGALCVLEFSTPPNPLMKLGYNVYRKVGLPFWGKLITGDASGFVYLGESISAFPNQEDFAHMLTEAGFERVEWHNVTFGVAAIHIAYKGTEA